MASVRRNSRKSAAIRSQASGLACLLIGALLGLTACGREIPEGYVKVRVRAGDGLRGEISSLSSCTVDRDVYLYDELAGAVEAFPLFGRLETTLTLGQSGFVADQQYLLRKGGPHNFGVEGFVRDCSDAYADPLTMSTPRFYAIRGGALGVTIDLGADIALTGSVSANPFTLNSGTAPAPSEPYLYVDRLSGEPGVSGTFTRIFVRSAFGNKAVAVSGTSGTSAISSGLHYFGPLAAGQRYFVRYQGFDSMGLTPVGTSKCYLIDLSGETGSTNHPFGGAASIACPDL